MESAEPRMRIDKWLWAARFFKTRQLAIEAINGGRVHLNGQRIKPGKEVSVGAKLSISKDQYLWDIEIRELRSQRRPAVEAVAMYAETPESVERRHAEVARRREEKSLGGVPDVRPNKRDRRLITRFRRLDE